MLLWQQLSCVAMAAPTKNVGGTVPSMSSVIRMNIIRVNDAAVRVVLGLSRLPRYEVFDLDMPPRLVIDLSGTVMAVDINRKLLLHTPVSNIRTANHPEDNTLRVVLDLTKSMPYHVQVVKDTKGKGHVVQLIIDVGAVKIPAVTKAVIGKNVKDINSLALTKNKARQPSALLPKLPSTTPLSASALQVNAASVTSTHAASHVTPNAASHITSHAASCVELQPSSSVSLHSLGVDAAASSVFLPSSHAVDVPLVIASPSYSSAISREVKKIAQRSSLLPQLPLQPQVKLQSSRNSGFFATVLRQINNLCAATMMSAREHWTAISSAVFSFGSAPAQDKVVAKLDHGGAAKGNENTENTSEGENKSGGKFDIKNAMTLIEPEKEQRVRDVVIVIDPGHGGKDPGARGKNGTREKDVVLAIAKALQRFLNQENGFSAVLTRDDDYHVGLHERLRIAHVNKADMFLSLHADAYKSRAIKGTTIFALSDRGATSEAANWLAEKENISELSGIGAKSRDLLRSVLFNLAQNASVKTSLVIGESLLEHIGAVTKLHTKRIEQAKFIVLQAPDIPSLLVETGFISDPVDELKLRDEHYQVQFAAALARGIIAYFKGHVRA